MLKSKFQLEDLVQTNELYSKMFCKDTPFIGKVKEIKHSVFTNCYGMRKETVILVKVGDMRAIDQDLLEKV